MNDVQFADGFDGTDPVAFGLGPAQLLTVVTGLVLAYLALQGPLPLYAAVPAALAMTALAAALGWLRIEGRPVVEWVVLGVRYLARPSSGTLVLARTGVAPSGGAALEDSSITNLLSPPVASQGGERGRLIPAALEAGTARCVTFFSLNGGSGRTTLATEVACLLAARGRWVAAGCPGGALQVALLDADPLSGTIGTRLGIPQPTVWEYATGAQRAGSVAANLVEHESGAHVLLGPPKPLTSGAQSVEMRRLAAVRSRLLAGGTHIVLIDTGNDMGPIASWVLDVADRIYIVLTPSSGGVQDAYRSTELLRRLGHREKLAYVINRCRPPHDLSAVMGDIGGRIAAQIPQDSAFEAAENRHELLSLGADGPAASALSQLAGHVCQGAGLP